MSCDADWHAACEFRAMQGDADQTAAKRAIAEELATLLYAERRRVERLSRISSEIAEKERALLLSCHQKEAERHVARLERAFAFLGCDPAVRRCAELDAIFARGEESCEPLTGEELDEARITVTKQLQCYREAAYRRTLAEAVQAGFDKVATMLRANLQEETAAGIELDRYASADLVG